MSELRFYFLGIPRCERSGNVINFERRKSFALLAYLLLTGEHYGRDTIAALFWPDYHQNNSRTTLRQVLTDIKQKLGDDFLEVGREVVGIRPNPQVWVDVIDFRDCLRLTHTHGHSRQQVCDQCIRLLTRAADLYRSDFLSGFTISDSAEFDEWQSLQTEQLRLELVDTLDRLISYSIQSKPNDAGFTYARRWIELNPLDERPHRYLMRLYADTGQKAATSDQFNLCKRLVEAAGLTLEPETMQLYSTIRDGHSSNVGTPTGSVTLSTRAARKGNLPTLPTTFVGRGKELEQIQDYLTMSNCRLLTLIGVPGVGKTRLSLIAAARLSPFFADGLFFIPLASINDASFVARSIARAVGLQERGETDILRLLKHYLATQSCLLLLDNFEHLLEASSVVGEILSAGPHLKILVTSREALELYGEHTFIVSPLTLPDQHEPKDVMYNEAVRLFTQRARAAASEFRLTEDNAPVIAEICRRLEGLPLAIELAATRVKLYSPEELLKLLDQRLSMLKSGLRDVPTRHQTLRGAIDWSYSLLSEAEARLFRRLGVFVGGCSLDCIKTVCSPGLPDVSEAVEALINKSLIQPAKGDRVIPRVDMLDTLGEYALEKLVESGEEWTVKNAVIAFFLNMVAQAQAELRGSNQRFWAQRLEDDYDNLRSVMKWLLEKDAIKTLQHLGNHLAAFWHDRGYLAEGRYWLEITLERNEQVPQQLKAETLEALFSLTWAQGDYAAARQYANQYLLLARNLNDAAIVAAALHALGGVALAEGEYAEARAYYEESRNVSRSPKKIWSTSLALTGIGEVAYLQGDYPSARSYFAEDLERARESGSPQAISAAINGLAKVADMQGDFDAAQAYAEESLLLAEKVKNQQGMAIALNRLGRIARQLGNYTQAQSLHEKSLSLARSIHNAPITAFTLNKLGEVAADTGDYLTAFGLHSEALVLNSEMNDPYYVADNLYYLAAVSLKQGDLDGAEKFMNEALQIAWRIKALVVLLQVFACFSYWYVLKQMYDQAIELIGFIVNHPALPASVAKMTLALYRQLEDKLPEERLVPIFELGKTLPIKSVVSRLLQQPVD